MVGAEGGAVQHLREQQDRQALRAQPIIRKRATAQAKENSRIAQRSAPDARHPHEDHDLGDHPSVHIQPTTPLS